jgi:FXSXX-COOH protein
MDDDAVLESDLLDVTDLDLSQLAVLPDSVLRASLQRILTEKLAMPDHYSAHQSSL